jgi:hypothetical protein
MLGDRFLGVALSAQGTLKDVGGQVFYLNQKNRLNWGYSLGRIPYQYLFLQYSQNENPAYINYDQIRYRIFNTSATGLLAYPFSTTRRIEGSFGVTRYGFDVENDRLVFDQAGRLVDQERIQMDELEGDPLNLFKASVALVGDNSFGAFTSPVKGGRYRLGVETTRGTVDFQTITADWRRYYSPSMNFSFAVRGLHYGRYGYDEKLTSNQFIQPLFLGWETFIRGYAWESFNQAECGAQQDGSCPAFDRLFGQRIAVANFEVRVPFIGTEQFGLVNLPYIPIELVAFHDIGIAWSAAADEQPVWEFSRSATERVPLMSTGLSARMNILGFMILEAYYAYPWNRPEKGAHFGFQLAPGW